jgi:hypothetical protein
MCIYETKCFISIFICFELLPSPHDAVGDISALQLVAYTANARIFFEGVVLLAGRFGTQFLGLPLLLRLWMGLPQYIAQNQFSKCSIIRHPF